MKPDETGHVGNKLWNRLPTRFHWTPHNMIFHPLSEVLFQFGFVDAGNRIHDWSVPRHRPDDDNARG